MQYRAGSTSGVLPTCTGSGTGLNERSRWATVLEALGIDFAREVATPIGRPMKLSVGTPVADLLAART
jgi:hypothetical protein